VGHTCLRYHEGISKAREQFYFVLLAFYNRAIALSGHRPLAKFGNR
jgi:hypothetical protein